MYIQQHQEIRKNHTLHQRYNLPNRPKQRTKISISLFTSFFHQKVTKHFQLWDLAGPLTRGIVIRDYVTNYDEPAVKWKTATKPVGLCHLRRAELWRSRPGWTLNASSPRRGLHSGPGVNQSFVLASLRVNRFRCSICLQRLHVHARTRPSVWPSYIGCPVSSNQNFYPSEVKKFQFKFLLPEDSSKRLSTKHNRVAILLEQLMNF